MTAARAYPAPTKAQLARLLGDYSVSPWKVTTVKRYPGNPRRNKKAVPKVIASLLAFGWQQPIVVDPQGVIIVGDTRYLAALALKLKTVPVHVAEDLTPEEATAYRLMDNRSAEEAEWDYARLELERQGLAKLDYDLGSTGFEPAELAAFPDLANEQRLADLSGDAAGNGHAGPARQERTATGLVMLSIPMTSEQRADILAAVHHAKTKLTKGALSSEALHLIATQWRKAQ